MEQDVSRPSYGTICVLYEGGDAASRRLVLATEMALAFGSALRVACIGLRESDPQWQGVMADARSRVLAILRGRVLSVQWMAIGPAGEGASAGALDGIDLVIGESVGLPDAAQSAASSLSESLLARGSLPVLLLPGVHAGAPRVGRRILIAWDGGDASRRAVKSALPFIDRADHVTLCAVTRYAGDGIDLESMDEAVRLRLRGVEPAVVVIDGADASGDARALLDEACRVQADLLVAGAFGHPRWQQRLIGGVTRSLLHSAPMPLFMHH